MKEFTEKELKNKAERYCLAAEHCPSEVKAKLLQWGASGEMADSLVAGLEKDRFIEVSRYCRAFVRDKYRFSHWGRIKIIQALRGKQIPEHLIEEGLKEVGEEDYEHELRGLLERKYHTISARNEYERKAKLIRFALGRGYAMSEIMKHIKEDFFHGDMD